MKNGDSAVLLMRDGVSYELDKSDIGYHLSLRLASNTQDKIISGSRRGSKGVCFLTSAHNIKPLGRNDLMELSAALADLFEDEFGK